MKWALYILTAGAAACGIMALTAAAKAEAAKASATRMEAMGKR